MKPYTLSISLHCGACLERSCPYFSFLLLFWMKSGLDCYNGRC